MTGRLQPGERRSTNIVAIGNIKIGGKEPIRVQSMTKCDTRNVNKTLFEIERLKKAGCEIVRIALPDQNAVASFREIRKRASIPLVADIHFDYRLALSAIEAGADKIRINPGNIGGKNRIALVIEKAKENNIPIRIGVNAGSIEKEILKKRGSASVPAILESIQRSIDIFTSCNFSNIVLSAKTTEVLETVEIYQTLARTYPYPLHLGITEAGLPFRGGLRSGVGLGILLYNNIGDTIRVSLTGDPVLEVVAGYEILRSLGLREYGPILISCPTCGRCELDIIKIASEVEERLWSIHKPIKVAVMGCSVNGPGEAKAADIGIAGGRRMGVIIKKGKIVKKVRESALVDELMVEIEKLV